MAYRVGHHPLGAAATGWLPFLADPVSRTPRRPRPMSPAALMHLAKAGFAHGVAPAMRRHLQRFADELGAGALVSGPDPAATLGQALAELDRRRILLAGQSLMLAHHARQIGAAFERDGVTAAVVKGLVFAERLYPLRAERTFTDVDLLLSPEAVEAAVAILSRLGYVPASDVDAHDNARRELQWLLPGNDTVLIELQTDLIHSTSLRGGVRFGYDAFLAAGNGDPGDATAQLFVAAIHGAAGHQFERLQPAIDVVQAARGAAGPIDEDRMIRVARTTGSTAALQSALDLVAQLFDEPAALRLADALAPAPWRAVRRHVVTPAVVLRAQAGTAWRDSWRRRGLREMIRRAGISSSL
jgi:hypothetical protein